MNAEANLSNPSFSNQYMKEHVEFLAVLIEEGASFTMESYAHDIGCLQKTHILYGRE